MRINVHVLRKFAGLFPLLGLLALAGCALPDGPPPDRADIDSLAVALRALGPEVDPEEAERAARIAYQYTYQLRFEYGVTTTPLTHNTRVNLGFRERGLCYHWADDLEARLMQERFRTLTLHRAVANAFHPIRIEHSTVIIARRGDTMNDGIVLDGWRQGGRLFWAPTRRDPEYTWYPREFVDAWKRERMAEKALAAQ
jgi:hypothetical protein